jgi:hypothetical protein
MSVQIPSRVIECRSEPERVVVKEPSTVTVEQWVVRRKRMSTSDWVLSTVELAQKWPLLLQRVREREHDLWMHGRKRIRQSQ